MTRHFVIFSGQSSEYIEELKLLALHPEVQTVLKALEADLVAECGTPELRRTGYLPQGLHPHSWATGALPVPEREYLIRSEVSQPMLFISAVCHALVGRLFPGDRPGLAGYSGHSQGIVAALFVAQGREDLADRLSRTTRYMMWQGVRMQNSCGWFTPVSAGEGPELTPMLAITGLSRQELEAHLATFPAAERPDISLCNAPDRFVLSGNPAHLAPVLAALKKKFGPESATRRLWFDTEPLAVSGAYHCRLMAQGRADIDADLDRLGLDFGRRETRLPVYSCHDGSRLDREARITKTLMDIQYTGTVDWPATLAAILGAHPDLEELWIPGPGPGLRKLTSGLLQGAPVRVVSGPDGPAPAAAPFSWPRVSTAPDGRLRFTSRFTERTGRKPLILAGMTPTTATARLVAAAANAGYVAELAGGGQVTEAIFRRRMEELAGLLEPGAAVVLNTLYLDPYLYDLHIRKEGLLFRLKKEGFPLAGFTLTAGIPPVAEAVALLDRARAHGLGLCSFKAGTPEQIEQMIAIAKAAPGHPLVIQIEGGEGGGHHSWYGLRNLLNRSYARLRDLPNVSLAAGGGVRDADDVTALLSGSWYGGPVARPLDAVLVGTLAMACAEAETSPAVKAALAAAPGEPSGWPRGPQAPVVSGRSGLGAPIWYLQNTAARVARLADELQANPTRLPALRDELARLLDRTAKPWFGDLEGMTYARFLERFVALTALGNDGPYDHGAWLAADHQERFAAIVRRVLQRLDAEGTFAAEPAKPRETVAAMTERFPALTERLLLPQDRAHFLQIFDQPGKPMPFVPVLDAELRRRFLSDSLFQSHDPRHGADAVLVIPGPRAVGGITVADLPVAGLFDGLLAAVVPGTPDHAVARELTWPEGPRAMHLLGDRAWTRLFEAAAVRGATGVRANPLAALFLPDAGDPVRVSPEAFSWTSGGLVKLSLDLAGDRVSGTYLLRLAGGKTIPLPLAFELADGWELPAWEDRTFFAEIDRIYREEAFLEAADEAGYAQALGRPAEFRAHPFLPWHASAALKDMVSGVDENPLGLLHYRCRVLQVATPLTGAPLERATAVAAGLQARHHFRAGDRVCFEVDGEFVPRSGKARAVGTRALPASAFALEESVFESDVVLGETSWTAPPDADVFALCGGDRNPLHADAGLARLVGFERPIHHGLWTQAAAVARLERSMVQAPRPISRLSTRFLGPVPFGARVDMKVVRRGRAAGRHLLRATVSVDSAPCVELDCAVEPHPTAYVCPGQGVQKKGMHEPAYSRSPAARDVWNRADAYTRSALGFSLLHAVRENPVRMTMPGGEVFHPEGVLNLTQFTQVALVVFSCAAVAELRDAGAFVEGAHFSGHSLGEYSALSAIGDLLTLEDVVRVVYHRGLTMQHYVPRDERGESPFRMGVIRPNHAGIGEQRMIELVAEVNALPGCHIEIVNFNCRGKQYAVTGYRMGLDALRERLGAGVTGKPPYVEVPGIDVPFHSTLLRDGVDAFRRTIEEVFPARIAPERLAGRYWPNLTGRVFELSAACLDDVLTRTGSERVAVLKRELEAGTADPELATRTLLIELLAYQFASPVQWIAIQEGLVRSGIREIIEIGPGHQPTLSNLLHQTLPGLQATKPVFPLHLENHFEWVTGASAEDRFCVFPEEKKTAEKTDGSAEKSDAKGALKTGASTVPTPSVPSAVSSVPSAVSSLAVAPAEPVACGLQTLLAHLAGAWPDELEADRSLEDLLQGNSARRNQMLSELQKEFGLKKTDGLADLPLKKLVGAVSAQTGGAYRLPGPNLAAARKEMFALLPGLGPDDAARHLTGAWAIDAAGAQSLITALAPYGREGKSKLTGKPNPFPFPAADAAGGRAILDAAAALGLGLTGPAQAATKGAGASAAVVDAAVLDELRAELTGPSGVLTRLGEVLAEATGRENLVPVPDPTPSPARGVPLDTPAFSEELAVQFSAAGNWIREDAARLVNTLTRGQDPDAALVARLDRRFSDSGMEMLRAAGERAALEGASESVKNLFDKWIERLQRRPDPVEAAGPALALRSLRGEPVATPELAGTAVPGTLIVTGAGARSIAEAVVCLALSRGWTVISGVSTLDDARVRAAAALYREHAAPCGRLWLAPMRQGSFEDVDAFARWAVRLAPAGAPLALLPFAAVGVNGMAQDVGVEHEQALRVNLLGVERLVARCAEELGGLKDGRRLHCVLPMSPNQGDMGGDGLYGESKIALRALLNKWYAEPLLRERTRLAGAVIGWVRGTGLMHGQDDLALQIEQALGVKTFDTATMGALIFRLVRTRVELATADPFTADCTGGLADVPDWGEAFRRFRARNASTTEPAPGRSTPLKPAPAKGALPFAPAPPAPAAPAPRGLPWRDWIVVVGYGEIGPYGDEECRWQAERDGRLAPEGILRIALMTGLLRYDRATGDLVDAASGERLGEREAAERHADEVHRRVGIRWRPESGPDAGFHASLEAVELSEPRLIPVESAEMARRICAHDPAHSECVQDPAGRVFVRKLPGARLYLACRRPYRNRVAGMLPAGWHPSFFGFSEGEIADRDRNTLLMLTATAGAIRKLGRSLKELFTHIHPVRVGNSLGTGIGGMERLIRLYTDPVWNAKRDPISLQESLGNVGAGHVSQELLGNYGPMVSPVSACATAGISVEIAWEKLKLGRADLMVAGAFDDISYAGTVGFDDMNATVDSALLARQGIPPGRMSRPQDRRRHGFVESQGGGTLLLMRAGDAVRLGLPIHAVVGGAWSFGDGLHQSIPAPGFGALSVAHGGARSPLARALAEHGLGIDDVGAVSLHGTSTPVNDPHETGIFQDIFEHLGRTRGLPALAVSQKAVTGHTKGGASACQLIGVIQMMRDTVVPGHLNLDDLEEKQQRFHHLVFPSRPMAVPADRLKAACVSTLGFGHVSSMVLVVNPTVLLAELAEEERKEYLQRSASASRPHLEMETLLGLTPQVQLAKGKGFSREEDEKRFLLEGGNHEE